MPRKALNPLTEPMFYVLLCFHIKDMSGNEIAKFVEDMTDHRVRMGPGTLYTILSLFMSEKLIEKVGSEGRKIFYSITERGEELYREEVMRLRSCVVDADKADALKDEQVNEPENAGR